MATRDKVVELQRALYWAAKASPDRRFHALYDKVHRRDVLRRAWVNVARNGGAAGVDGVTIAAVEEAGVVPFLDDLAAELAEGRWRPAPVRRVEIPKPDGRTRPLGIPTVRDRVVQAALKIVLEPVFEADFAPCSFGFRPKRSTHHALNTVMDEAWAGRRVVVEADIASFLDAWSHCSLADCWGFEQGVLWGWDLDTQAFSASGAGEDGAELAALDLVQNGLAGDAEGAAGVVQGEPAVGGVVDEHAA